MSGIETMVLRVTTLYIGTYPFRDQGSGVGTPQDHTLSILSANLTATESVLGHNYTWSIQLGVYVKVNSSYKLVSV